MAKHHVALGIDIGGSGIKGAVVNLEKGEFRTKRKKILTPKPATPEAVIEVVAQLVDHFIDDIDDNTAVGVTVPAVVQHGVVLSAANIDPTWIAFEGEKALEKRLGRDVYLVNDADAAGYAELHYGAGKDEDGLVILTTLGTGIGQRDPLPQRPRAQQRARPPRDRRQGRRGRGRVVGEGHARPDLRRVHPSAAALLLRRRSPVLARPVRRRRWRSPRSRSCSCPS